MLKEIVSQSKIWLIHTETQISPLIISEQRRDNFVRLYIGYSILIQTEQISPLFISEQLTVG